MNLSRGLSLAALAVLALIPACNSGGGGSGKIKVAIVSNNPEEFWTIAEAGARKGAKDFDVDVIFRKPEKGDVTVQMDIVNALVKQGIAGIAVSVINPQEQAPDLKRIAAQTKLVTMDNDAEGTDRICYIGTDNYAAGKAAGRLVKEALPEGGTVAIFVGQMSALNAQQRFHGVVDELAGRKDAEGPTYGKYTLYRGEAITDAANREQSKVNAQQALAKIGGEPKVCLVGLWAYNAPTLVEAVSADKAYQHVKIVGFDEDWLTLDGVENGKIHGTVVQDPFNFGYKSVEVLAAEARGDTSKRVKEAVPYRVITKDGKVPPGENNKGIAAAEFRKDLRTLLDSVKQ
jgi:ribose transport system substrate-binding protein